MEKDIHSVPELTDAAVHIWRIPLMAVSAPVHYHALLAPDERARASHFRSEIHSRRFVIARARMRILLASYLRCEPSRLAFSYSAHGKPYLANSLLAFNLSHAHETAIFGVTRKRAIGVDIEHLETRVATDEIAARYFSEGEVRALRALPLELRCAAFFRCWTRKEAYIKARGEGLSMPLGDFEVCLEEKEELWLINRKDLAEQARWQLRNVPAPEGYFAAAAVEGRDIRFHDFIWSESLDVRAKTISAPEVAL